MVACNGGHLDIVQYLVNKRVDVNAKANVSYRLSAYLIADNDLFIHFFVVTYFKNGLTPLFFACDVGTLDVVKYLISQGSDINAKDNVII
jgi:ankyrin repeat protein